MSKNALIIGSGGGIASALITKIAETQQYERIYTVSRSQPPSLHPLQHHHVMDTCDAEQVSAYISEFKAKKQSLDYVVCATGILHQSGNMQLKPEKRLEDMRQDQFAEYFRVNTVLPAMWLQQLVKIVDKASATIVFFSARVGSISDNSLGGWYGYRASKAALNMVVKTAAIEYKRRSPNTILVCYHPGTVDTDLSKPFQGNVKPGKLFTPDFTSEALLSVTQNLDPALSPYYLDWQGQQIPW